MPDLRLGVLIDYQNIHLTAHETFAPIGTEVYNTLVHPVLFAERVVAVRQAAQQAGARQATLTHIGVYRGTPSNKKQPRLYSANQSQKSEWSRDPRVVPRFRPLKYYNWPTEPGREKGVDVELAIDLVRAVYDGQPFDVLVVASHDTDLEPALDMAAAAGRIKIETAGWVGCRRLRPNGRTLWHTYLDGADFVATRDRKRY